MAQYINRANVSGMYDGTPVSDFSELSVEVSALEIVKTSNKLVWVKGPLDYTIVVTNIDDDVPGFPVESVEVTDLLQPDVAVLVADSVEIDGSPATVGDDYTYDAETGLLTVFLPAIAVGGSHTITFQVTKVL